MTLPIYLMSVLLASIALLGVLRLVQAIRRRIRYWRVRRELHAVQRSAYRERPQRGVPRKVWEGGSDDAA